ncbi:putative RING-H2 finger protein ATL69 [Aristolochia californica]|uniref:putative RING-H2 finger protein ATL69 n=1 Tax=Aristolochia californica TaxID=171875 RepID=UPI0035DC9228
MSSNSVSSPLPEAAGSVGLGYGIAIAVGILVLVSTIMLASYACVRVKGGGPQTPESASVASDNNGRSRDADVVVVVGGLDGATIESYPKFVYRGGGGGGSEETNMCSICLGEYSGGEVLRRMPECKHCFHARCVDEWLRMNATCPMCRNSPVPTPVATPLSELIPLAMHAR